MDDLGSGIATIGGICFVLALVVWIISHSVNRGIRMAQPMPPQHLPPGLPPPLPPLPDGPGRYRIVGVDRATKMDTTWHCEAKSAANAKVKAELEGIIVTSVERN